MYIIQQGFYSIIIYYLFTINNCICVPYYVLFINRLTDFRSTDDEYLFPPFKIYSYNNCTQENHIGCTYVYRLIGAGRCISKSIIS